MLTVLDVAKRLKISERSVRFLVARGEVRHVRLGRLVRIPEDAVEEIEAIGISRLVGPR